uniref:Uncharacterized protein n=1 Tax=Neogobius melanostomus TaxID=47308 RepID=A0A8C6UWZ6_9GOBI
MVNEESLDPKSASESGRIVALSEEDRTILAKSVNSSYREFIQGATMKFTGALLWLWMLTECEGAKPSKCPPAEAPENGGLFCVTISDRRFCKPLCHHGYDFGFLRRSRAYEECSNQTQYKWNTQYVGGNRLAVCNEAALAIAGSSSDYFPKEQSCLQTKANSTLLGGVMEQLLAKLRTEGHQGSQRLHASCAGWHTRTGDHLVIR